MAPAAMQVDASNKPLTGRKVGLLFVGSGCAALLYEVIWFHLLRLVIGGSSLSMAILLASFMGGMCLGSIGFAKLVPTRFHPLKVYAALELGIAIIGCLLPWWLPALTDWYVAFANPSEAGILARSIVAGICLLPPTILMGATLPAISRWVLATPQGLAQLGVFYGANTIGAVLGCLLAGFVLLPQTDVIYASYFAASINLVIALAAYGMAEKIGYTPLAETDWSPQSSSKTNASGIVCLIIALSGFTALSSEVVWTRLISLLYGTTTYTFAIILAVFLMGIGLGSTLAARIAKQTSSPLRLLGISQLALVLFVPLAGVVITRLLPYWDRPRVEDAYDIYWVFFFDMLRTFTSVFLPALFWGAAFSFALAAAGRGRGDSARFVGQVYAANTLGAILGALLTGSFLVSWLGSVATQRVLVVVSGLAALLAFLAARRQSPAGLPAERESHLKTRPSAQQPRFGAFVALTLMTLCGVSLVAQLPQGMLGNAVYPSSWEKYDYLFEKEGQNTAVSVQEYKGRTERYLCVSGKVVASTLVKDLRLQRMLGHLPALLHPEPKNTLTVGMGTGTTAGSFVVYPGIEHINICEIEPAVLEASGEFFVDANNDVLNDPRTNVTIDDARHYMATSKVKFDVITSDPIHPWVRGAAALFSQEYYELCKARLNPGGIVVQWIPLYQSDYDTVSCELATFMSAFPVATFWSSGDDPRDGYDVVAIGWADNTAIDLAEMQQRIDNNERLKANLDEVGIGSVPRLFRQYCGNHLTLKRTVENAEINHDRSLKLEYMAGLSLFFQEPDAIYSSITEFIDYPSQLLVNDQPFKAEIIELLELDRR